MTASVLIAQDFDYSFKENFKVSGETHLKLQTSDGFIHLTPHDGNSIEVYFIVKKNNRFVRIDKRELEKELELTIDQFENKIEIRVRHHNNNWFHWRNRLNVSFEVLAPRNTLCDLRTSDGNIDIVGFTGDQSCKTSDGNIEVYDIDGSVFARTSDGNIKARKIEGNAELNTSDGDINAYYINGDATLRTSDGDINIENANGATSLSTSDGSIEFMNLSGSLTAGTSDGSIRGEMTQLSGKLKLSTSDGNIDVKIPDDIGIDLYLRGEKFYTNFRDFSGTRSKRKMEGSVNGGGIPVTLTTSDGRISINYRR